MAVLLLAGDQPAGPRLPGSVSPPGAHHRVGIPILLLNTVPIPTWIEGILLPVSSIQLTLGEAPALSFPEHL